MTFDANTAGAALGSWTLTYLLHATVFLAGAALATIALRSRPEIEEAIWKLALVGGLVTASVQPLVADWWAVPSAVAEKAILAAAASGARELPATVGLATSAPGIELRRWSARVPGEGPCSSAGPWARCCCWCGC